MSLLPNLTALSHKEADDDIESGITVTISSKAVCFRGNVVKEMKQCQDVRDELSSVLHLSARDQG